METRSAGIPANSDESAPVGRHRCARLARESKRHWYAEHLRVCLDCDRVWHVIELVAPAAAPAAAKGQG